MTKLREPGMSVRRVLGIVLGGVLVPVVIAVAVNAATDAAFPGPLRLIQRYPWWSVLLILGVAAAYAVWEIDARAGLITARFAPLPSVPVVVLLVLAVGWVQAYAPSAFFTGLTDTSGDDKTYCEYTRRLPTGILAGLVAVGFNLVPCIVLFRWVVGAAHGSLIGRILLVPVAVLVDLSFALFWIAIAIIGTAFTPDELSDWLHRQGARLGAATYAIVAVLVAGAAAGAAGAVFGYALHVLVAPAPDPLPMSWLYWWFGAGPAAFAAGRLVLVAQYAVSDACTPGIVYHQLARRGELPPQPARFLAWAESHLLLRRTGDGYVFLHRLYRDWWAAQR